MIKLTLEIIELPPKKYKFIQGYALLIIIQAENRKRNKIRSQTNFDHRTIMKLLAFLI